MTFEVPGAKYMIRGQKSKKCPCCGSTNITLDEEKYEVYCNRCGHVINDCSLEYGRPSLKKEKN